MKCRIFMCILVIITEGFAYHQRHSWLRVDKVLSRSVHKQQEHLKQFSSLCDFIPSSEYAKLGKKACDISVQSLTGNKGLIQASMIVNTQLENVWSILTDYSNLSKHVPNLVKSEVLPCPYPNKIRLFQEGAQKIMGFDFRASLTLDMTEEKGIGPSDDWKIPFQLVSSGMFDEFDGCWTLQRFHEWQEYDVKLQKMLWKYKTKLNYKLQVHPKIPIPMIGIEWRIKEDVPANLFAMKVAAEHLPTLPV